VIVILIALWSLCAIYFTHVLHKSKLRVASIAVATMYIFVTVWTYLIFILDVANLGYKESKASLLVGSDIFHSFNYFRDLMSSMPLGLHKATASVAILLAASILFVLVLSSIRIYKEFTRKMNSKFNTSKIKEFAQKVRDYFAFNTRKIHILHCRLNN